MTPCILINKYFHFGGFYRTSRGRKIESTLSYEIWTLSTKLHGVTSQKIVIFTNIETVQTLISLKTVCRIMKRVTFCWPYQSHEAAVEML